MPLFSVTLITVFSKVPLVASNVEIKEQSHPEKHSHSKHETGSHTPIETVFRPQEHVTVRTEVMGIPHCTQPEKRER